MLSRFLAIIVCLFLTEKVYSQSVPDTVKRAEMVTIDSISASELGSMVLDKHVSSFVLTWYTPEAVYTYKIAGNAVFGEATTKILALPRGNRVAMTEITRKEDDGSITFAPAKIYIIK